MMNIAGVIGHAERISYTTQNSSCQISSGTTGHRMPVNEILQHNTTHTNSTVQCKIQGWGSWPETKLAMASTGTDSGV